MIKLKSPDIYINTDNYIHFVNIWLKETRIKLLIFKLVNKSRLIDIYPRKYKRENTDFYTETFVYSKFYS